MNDVSEDGRNEVLRQLEIALKRLDELESMAVHFGPVEYGNDAWRYNTKIASTKVFVRLARKRLSRMWGKTKDDELTTAR